MEHSVSKNDNSVDNAVLYPPVDIVVVAHESDQWFEDTLTSFAIQDYPNFNVVVLTTGGESEMSDFVSGYLPDAETIPVDSKHGYGKNLNTVLEREVTSAFFLFCHHDVALAPDALRLMVEESLRSNAGVVGPKIVNWDRPDELLEIGSTIDKLGYSVPRIELGELDQEQHDAVADVFVVSSIVALVRTDLFQALGGFDEEIGMVGEDLDMCWRAHLAGARAVVVPLAIARHREEKGEYRSGGEEEKHRERHRLRAILSNYGFVHSLRIVPQAFLLSIIRTLGSLLVGDFERVRVLLGAWIWNLSRPRTLYRRRRKLSAIRRLPDSEIRALQSPGYALFSTLFKDPIKDQEVEGSGALADRFKKYLESMRSGPSKVSAVFISISLLVFIFGSRHLITRKVPVIGELVPFDLGIQESFSGWFSNWWMSGTGHEATNPTALGITGVLGVLTFGFMGLLRLLLTLGMIPLGAVGVWYFLKPFNSPWIRATGTAIYLASPVPYSGLAVGSWSSLILFGTLPWFLSLFAKAGKVSPFGPIGGPTGIGVLSSNWLREVLGIGITVGVMVAFFPFAMVVILAIAVLFFVGSLLAGWPSGTFRLISILLLGVVVALALNLPWLIDVVAFDPSWHWLVGTRPTSGLPTDISPFLRLTVDTSKNQFFGWGFLAIALVPLLLAKGERWAWAVRSWSMYLGGVAVLWSEGNGWLSVPMPRPEVLLVPASLGVAIAAAMGAGALQRDLQTYRFGWRQLIPISAIAAFVLAVLPIFGTSFSGDWGMPNDEINKILALQESETSQNGRVLWIGHDDVLAAAGNSFYEDLTFAVTSDLQSSFLDRWDSGTKSGEDVLEEAILLALDGGTNKLGRLLSPLGISDIVLVSRSSPLPSKGQIEPIPTNVLAIFAKQLDLVKIPVSPGIVRYQNIASLPSAAVIKSGETVGRTLRSFASDPLPESAIWLSANNPSGTSYSGYVNSESEIFLSVPRNSSWDLFINGTSIKQEVALEWAVGFQPQRDGTIDLRHKTPPRHRLMILMQALLWVGALYGFLRLSLRPARSIR